MHSGIGTQQVQSGDSITHVEFAAPHPDLRPYITTYYIAKVHSADGAVVEDLLHPEWASVRYVCDGSVNGSVLPGPMVPVPPVSLIGHSSFAAQIGCTSMRIASFGLFPLGWHRFVGLPASRFADRLVDAYDVKSRVDFAGLFAAVAKAKTVQDVAPLFDTLLLQELFGNGANAPDDEAGIVALHKALLDPDIATVAGLSDRLSLSAMQLERLSKKAFGFPPKLLIRRQRFLRTLNALMRKPDAKWADILDPQYHDQAHFNRDFRRFFNMSPTEYLAREKPIVMAGAMARMAALGDPLQGLHAPQSKN